MLDKKSALWNYLSSHQKELLEDGDYLFDVVKTFDRIIYDYSFLVFPYAKAYEGFLKKLFFDLGFIDEGTYRGVHFRIGKALNPRLEPKYRNESMYDKVVGYCGGQALANELWEVWKRGRNLIFHYFPHNEHKITLLDAQAMREEMLEVMEKCLLECKIPRKLVSTP